MKSTEPRGPSQPYEGGTVPGRSLYGGHAGAGYSGGYSVGYSGGYGGGDGGGGGGGGGG
jgi:hypothetical protein